MKKIINTPTFTFNQISSGKHPDDFKGESDFRHIRIDWGYTEVHPSNYLYPSNVLYPKDEKE